MASGEMNADETRVSVGLKVGESVLNVVDELATLRYTNRATILREAVRRYVTEEAAKGALKPDVAHGAVVRLPEGFNASQRQVYDLLASMERPMRTRELADIVGIHPGNIDRALRALRDAGYVERVGHGYHQISQSARIGEEVAATG